MNNRTFGIRLLEIFPGTLTWITLLGAPFLAYSHPVWISVYVILFDLYWFLKGANVAFHLMHSYRNLKTHSKINWQEWVERLSRLDEFKSYLSGLISEAPDKRLKKLYQEQMNCLNNLPAERNLDWKRIYHVIILATVKENLEVLESSIASYVAADYDHSKIIMVLATEERGGAEAWERAQILANKFDDKFYKFLISKHPDGIAGEAKVKGANIT